MVSEAQTVKAMNVIARWMLHNAFKTYMEEHNHGDLPDIGESDYAHIVQHAKRLLPEEVRLVQYQAAYQLLVKRANTVTLTITPDVKHAAACHLLDTLNRESRLNGDGDDWHSDFTDALMDELIAEMLREVEANNE